MSNVYRREYLKTILPKYTNANTNDKNKILNEFCNICGSI